MPKGTTKNKGRKDPYDRYYTNVDEAKRLVDVLLSTHPELSDFFFIEPAAGNGSFVLAMRLTF